MCLADLVTAETVPGKVVSSLCIYITKTNSTVTGVTVVIAVTVMKAVTVVML